MPTIIHKNKLYISVEEVMNFMLDFKNNMENKREECINDIKKSNFIPELEKMSITLTNLDYDMFIEALEKNVIQYQERLKETAKEKIANNRC